MPKQRKQGRKRLQCGRGGINLVGALQKLTPPEMHWLSYQFLGTFTKLEKCLKRGDKGINRLDCIAKSHHIDYSKAKSKEDIWKADEKMVKAIDSLRKKLLVLNENSNCKYSMASFVLITNQLFTIIQLGLCPLGIEQL